MIAQAPKLIKVVGGLYYCDSPAGTYLVNSCYCIETGMNTWGVTFPGRTDASAEFYTYKEAADAVRDHLAFGA